MYYISYVYFRSGVVTIVDRFTCYMSHNLNYQPGLLVDRCVYAIFTEILGLIEWNLRNYRVHMQRSVERPSLIVFLAFVLWCDTHLPTDACRRSQIIIFVISVDETVNVETLCSHVTWAHVLNLSILLCINMVFVTHQSMNFTTRK